MRNFVVSARKYRPQRFDEVVGQGHVAQTLKNALANDHLAHAFLFCGPRGVGKTTCARILAKVLNCMNPTSDQEACNECSSCKGFNDNASFNITELDAASNNSVEQMRALIEQVRFAPQQGEYRVFIIDEVHMLSASAFNAFLKTLEEPPSYAKFILATTEKHKILPTILSRCQIFDFKRIQVADIVSHLEGICKKEKIDAAQDALHIIAQKADGALRDALSIFDRIVSFGGDKINYDDVISNLNILDYDYYFKVIDYLMVEDLPNLLNIFNEILQNGFEPDIFMSGLLEHLRNLLVCKNESTVQLLEVSDSLKQKYLEQSKTCSTALILSAINLGNDCDVNYRMARNKRLHVEMAIVKMAYINRLSQAPVFGGSEKKKFDRIIAKPAGKIPNNSEKASAAQTLDSAAVNKPIQETNKVAKSSPVANHITPVKVEANDVVKQPVANTPKVQNVPAQKSAAIAADSASLLLSKLENEFLDEDAEEGDSEIPTLETIERVWAEQIALQNSPTFKNILKHAKIELNENVLVVHVGSTVAKEMVINGTEFSRALKHGVSYPNLIMQVNVDPEQLTAQQQVQPKKVLTIKETYEQMKEINPAVEDLRKKFGLKVDK